MSKAYLVPYEATGYTKTVMVFHAYMLASSKDDYVSVFYFENCKLMVPCRLGSRDQRNLYDKKALARHGLLWDEAEWLFDY